MSTHTPTNPHDSAHPQYSTEEHMAGMTKRELMAMHICAILADNTASRATIADEAVQQADALIAALNKPVPVGRPQ